MKFYVDDKFDISENILQMPHDVLRNELKKAKEDMYSHPEKSQKKN